MKPETMIERLRHLLARNAHPRIMVGRKLLEGALDVVLAQREEGQASNPAPFAAQDTPTL